MEGGGARFLDKIVRGLDPLRGAAAFKDCLNLDLGALAHIGRLRPLLSLGDFELYLITFLKAFIPLGCDGAVVNKNVGTIRTSDEPVAFCVIEPLYRAFHLSPYPLLPHVL